MLFIRFKSTGKDRYSVIDYTNRGYKKARRIAGVRGGLITEARGHRLTADELIIIQGFIISCVCEALSAYPRIQTRLEKLLDDPYFTDVGYYRVIAS